MKTKHAKLKNTTICIYYGILMLFVVACSKDTEGETPVDPPPTGSGELIVEQDVLTTDDFEENKGEIGLFIDTRAIKKRGYNPVKVEVTTTAKEGNYDQELDIDPYLNSVSLSIPVEGLSETAFKELRDGVGIDISVFDQNDEIIITQSYSIISFRENGEDVVVQAASLPYVEREVEFKKGIPHYLQLASENGEFNAAVVWKPSSALNNNVKLTRRTSSFNRGTTSEQYYIHNFPGTNQFAIWSANTGRYLATDQNDKTFRQSGFVSHPTGIEDNSLSNTYRFIIKMEPNGLYTINDMAGNPMKSGGGGWSTAASNQGPIQYFRIISLDIEWSLTELDTEFQEPIYPPAKTIFSVNSLLSNCASGTLKQTLGAAVSQTTTYSATNSETLGISARETFSTEVSVGVTGSASFFGSGVAVNADVTAGLEQSLEVSQTSTYSDTKTTSEEKSFFVEREVVVPPGKATLVYDVYQIYENVRVPYVKRLRLRGLNPDDGVALTGIEIATQLDISEFAGTQNVVGDDFVEITIKGIMRWENIWKTDSATLDQDPKCPS